MKKQNKVFLTAGGGLTFILLGEFAILLGIEPLKVWVTPFCWTGYILFVDSFVYQRKKSSFIQNSPLEALFSIPISAGLWALFEGYNLLLKNWEYLNVPSNPLIAYPGYFWSFGTILPALLETNDLLEEWGCFKKVHLKPSFIPKKGFFFSFLLGALFLIYPLLTASSYDFTPVWLGFVFLLEPINYRFGGESLLRRLEKGSAQRFFTLLLSGGVMGLLWEFWNYWAGAKWVYHIPVPTPFKIFEMPLLGFLGFFPFAIEFYTMYHFVLLLLKKIPHRRERIFKRFYTQYRVDARET